MRQERLVGTRSALVPASQASGTPPGTAILVAPCAASTAATAAGQVGGRRSVDGRPVVAHPLDEQLDAIRPGRQRAFVVARDRTARGPVGEGVADPPEDDLPRARPGPRLQRSSLAAPSAVRPPPPGPERLARGGLEVARPEPAADRAGPGHPRQPAAPPEQPSGRAPPPARPARAAAASGSVQAAVAHRDRLRASGRGGSPRTGGRPARAGGRGPPGCRSGPGRPRSTRRTATRRTAATRSACRPGPWRCRAAAASGSRRSGRDRPSRTPGRRSARRPGRR